MKLDSKRPAENLREHQIRCRSCITIDLHCHMNHRHRDVFLSAMEKHYWNKGCHPYVITHATVSSPPNTNKVPSLRSLCAVLEHPIIHTHTQLRLAGLLLIGLLFFNDPLFICKILSGGTNMRAGAGGRATDPALCLCLSLYIHTQIHKYI